MREIAVDKSGRVIQFKSKNSQMKSQHLIQENSFDEERFIRDCITEIRKIDLASIFYDEINRQLQNPIFWEQFHDELPKIQERLREEILRSLSLQ